VFDSVEWRRAPSADPEFEEVEAVGLLNAAKLDEGTPSPLGREWDALRTADNGLAVRAVFRFRIKAGADGFECYAFVLRVTRRDGSVVDVDAGSAPVTGDFVPRVDGGFPKGFRNSPPWRIPGPAEALSRVYSKQRLLM
jgi:hypothetical protein